MTTPISDASLPRLSEFTAALHGRVSRGRDTYGDSSFHRPFADVLEEIEEELLDVAGWGFVLWCRVRALRERLADVEVS